MSFVLSFEKLNYFLCAFSTLTLPKIAVELLAIDDVPFDGNFRKFFNQCSTFVSALKFYYNFFFHILIHKHF